MTIKTRLCYRTMRLRRARGLLLRIARRRPLAIGLGVLLAAPSAWIELGDRFGARWIDGVCLVVGATGLALVWIGLAGPSADWIEP